MAGRATQTIEDWTYGPARWLGAGLLAGAAAIGMVWSYSARRVPIEPAPPTVHAVPSSTRPSDSAHSPAPAQIKPVVEAPRPIVTELAPVQTAPPAPASAAKETPKSPKAETAKGPEKTININSASVEELEKLPSVGPALASRIVDDRARNGPFRKVEDLDRVKGIGPKLIEKMRPFIVVE